MIVVLTQPPVPIVLLITSFRTQIQNAKLIVQQERMRTNQVTGNAQTVYQTVILVVTVVLVLHALQTITYKMEIQNAKLLAHQEHIKSKLLSGFVKIV